MSQRTRTTSASPPIRSIVSGELASTRPRLESDFLAACFVVRLRTVFAFVVTRLGTDVRCRRFGAAGVGAGGCTSTGAGGETITAGVEGDGAGGGAAGGGETCVRAGGLGCGATLRTGSGFGTCERGGAGSGAGPS